jgi:EAL domain-containing protein (putative c-di-GMP-specific phosphodiesterase class I)
VVPGYPRGRELAHAPLQNERGRSDKQGVLTVPKALSRARRRLSRGNRAGGFGLRLLVAVGVALAAIGVVTNVLLTDQLEQRQIDDYARTQRADVRSFEEIGRENSDHPAIAVREVGEFIDAIGKRPGMLEALLIDRNRVVRASGADESSVGTRDSDERIDAAVERGRSYAGHEADPAEVRSNFEFVAPVDLPDGRYVFEVSYDHGVVEGHLADIRRALALLGALALLVGGAVFRVVGGRSLMRSHRSALQRATLDGLTDLPNQRAFHDELPQAVASAARHRVPLALAVLDLDDFKHLNDRYGHPRGDALLRRVSAVLREGRSGDRAYRVGGDEFALLLPHTVRRLIEEQGASTVFQPIWDLDEGRLVGHEALTRPDESYGLAGPAEAFDIAEQLGRVRDLDMMCARRALAAARALASDAPLFLNLAPHTLDLDGAEDADWLKLAVEDAGLSVDRVVVEVTERFAGRTASVIKGLERLRNHGFKLALDDVGTGNSGLEMLRKVGADYVKIDSSIVTAAAAEPNARAVLMAMATFASHSGSFVIAEGIEDSETLAFVLGIDDEGTRSGHVIQGGQGYGLGYPSPEAASEPPSLLAQDQKVPSA